MARGLLLDTSFLLVLFQKPLKAFERLELSLGKVEPLVSDSVLEELRRLASSRSIKKRRLAQKALEYAEGLKRLGLSSTDMKVDDVILGQALAQELAVATLDQKLIRRLRKAGITVVTCKGDEIVVEGPRL